MTTEEPPRRRETSPYWTSDQHLSDDDIETADPVYDDNDSTALLGPVSLTPSGAVVYACFLCMGLGTLLPWNFFITAESYWQFKFRNVSINGTGDDVDVFYKKTYLQELYTPMQVFLSQFPNFIFLLVNIFLSNKIPQRIRLIGSLSVMITFFIITTALVMVDTNSWQTGFFAITMVIIIIMNTSGAIFQGGLFGVAGMFPEKYMNAVMNGQALGGVFASASRIVSLAAGANDQDSAFIYFMIAVAVMGLTLFIYIYVSSTEFFKHYTNCQNASESDDKGAVRSKAEYGQVFYKIWPLGVSVFAVFAMTLGAFPAVCVRITSTSDNATWRNIYFQPVVTFLLFNVGDYLGRQMAGLLMWPSRGSKILYVMVALRVVFVPLFLLCNHDPNSNIPSVFTHDAWYIVIMLLFSTSNGYCSAICMMYGPRMVEPEYAETAGAMMATMLGLGLLTGGMSSFGFALIS